MEINVKLMKEEAYKTLQVNSKQVLKEIQDHPSDCSWLGNYLGYEPFEVKKYYIEDFELKNDEDYDNVCLENALTLYESLKELPNYILCNVRFWAWIYFEKAYKIAPNIIKLTPNTIVTRYLVDNSRRNLMLGVMSRQYFKVVATLYNDEPVTDLTEFILKKHTPYKNLTMRNIGMLPNLCIPYLEICKDHYEKGLKLDDYFCSSLMKTASRIASIRYIDLMNKEEIKEELLKVLPIIERGEY